MTFISMYTPQMQRFGIVTTHHMAGLNFSERWGFIHTARAIIITATGMEITSGGRIRRIGHIAGEDKRFFARPRVRRRHSGEQGFGVRVQRLGE